MPQGQNEEIAVYIHFPYCKSRCPYCDFFKNILPKDFCEETLLKKYIEDLDESLKYIDKKVVKSIFFGGGTPSILSPCTVEKVIGEINKRFHIKKNAEITIEANPNTYDKEKFLSFRNAGINRLSLGVQALNDKDLRFLGRTHNAKEALTAMELAAKVFPKFSIDLMYALPNQEDDIWFETIDKALSYDLKHISLYQLTIEEGTIFERKKIELPDENHSLRLYNDTVSYLREHGFERYEVSNFAKDKENESVHNLTYWQGGDYLGLGRGAHGRIKTKDKILATVDGKIVEELTPQERAEELVIMGLRTIYGIEQEWFYKASGLKIFDFLSKKMTKRLANLKFLVYDDDHIRLNDNGIVVLDKVIEELLI